MISIYKKFMNMISKYRGYRGNDIDYDNAKILLKNDEKSVLIDVRSPQEYKEKHLKRSINIPLYDLSKKIDTIVTDKSTSIICYCQSGNRSEKAMEILSEKGYTNIYNIKGGLDNIYN